MNEFKIIDRKIGYRYKPLVIEDRINHEGSLKNAFKIVDCAADAGAEL